MIKKDPNIWKRKSSISSLNTAWTKAQYTVSPTESIFIKAPSNSWIWCLRLCAVVHLSSAAHKAQSLLPRFTVHKCAELNWINLWRSIFIESSGCLLRGLCLICILNFKHFVHHKLSFWGLKGHFGNHLFFIKVYFG